MINNNKRSLNKTALSLALAGGLMATNAQAQLAGHNVILVHGFMMENLSEAPANL
ncbi:MAG: hypothetical protein HLUCCX14_02300 [Marinobacter excellens HL-55]|uniref:Alpha/beta hydrolase n=1 Tax=Marinobacter excellens HL-55 TaxID=1305731 RepID=A0A0P7ZMC1_9GAMM|nr:MAG: hypothetical protein HLUCCX14_02300 [Marinobacter excellens HL-55]